MHYLYVAAPINFTKNDCDAYKAYLEGLVGQYRAAIQSVKLVLRENLFGFQGNHKNPYIKITTTDSRHIPKVRRIIESGEANFKGLWQHENGILTFDNIQYVLRFMIDTKVIGLTINSCPVADSI